MKNKGFTLIEMLAVIAILIILSLMITKQVGESINKSKEVTYNTQIEELENIAKLYINQNNMLNDDIIIIQLDDLKNSKLLKQKKIINPKTNKEMTGCILVRYQDNKYNYEYTEDDNKCNPIIVTFDPNGGRLDKTTKKVVYNEQYGELPTPTKEGYTFMGWNGKNLFDEESILMAIEGVTKENGYYYFNVHQAHVKYKNGIPTLIFKDNMQYTMTIVGYSYGADNNGNNGFTNFRFAFKYTDENTSYSGLNYKSETTLVYSSQANKQLDSMTVWYGYGGAAYIKNVQLEVGNTSTPYEPYYVTSDVTVTQENNHTLKAIWEPAS